MPDLNWNRAVWDKAYTWHDQGEEWSSAWGGSEAQWFGAIFPRLHRFLPAGRILEIAPGFGRWTRFLIPACDEFVGVDLSPKCTAACRERFSACKHASFFVNDGQSLEAVAEKNYDLVFSFDSLVHADPAVLAAYIPQILMRLSSVGVAFLHHSNLLEYKSPIGNTHGRSASVSADLVASFVGNSGGKILVQEVVNWGGEHLIDCLTLFTRAANYPAAQTVKLRNPLFMGEAKIIQHFQSLYSRIVDERPAAATAKSAAGGPA
jgi:SAM-dependent methyltransferase